MGHEEKGIENFEARLAPCVGKLKSQAQEIREFVLNWGDPARGMTVRVHGLRGEELWGADGMPIMQYKSPSGRLFVDLDRVAYYIIHAFKRHASLSLQIRSFVTDADCEAHLIVEDMFHR